MKKTWKYTIEDVYKVAGEDLTEKMLALLDNNKEDLVTLFYEPNRALKGKSPYNFCLEGKHDELDRILMDILTAAQGG